MTSRELRERIGLSRPDWARALNVQEVTVKRWEDHDTDPGGLALEIMLGIQGGLDEGLDPVKVGRLVQLGGLRSLICYGLVKRLRAPATEPTDRTERKRNGHSRSGV